MIDKTSLGIRIFGIWYVLQGTVMSVRKMMLSISSLKPMFIIAVFASSLLLLISGIGLIRLKEWSRRLTVYLNIYYLILVYLAGVVSVLRFGVAPYYKGIIIRLLLFIFVNVYFIFPVYFFSRLETKKYFK